jgi:hypothetical protein
MNREMRLKGWKMLTSAIQTPAPAVWHNEQEHLGFLIRYNRDSGRKWVLQPDGEVVMFPEKTNRAEVREIISILNVPAHCPVCEDSACETKSQECGK